MNETDTTYREKGRAVFLAAIMVLSVVALSASFAGTAAAVNGSEDVNFSGVSSTQETTGDDSDYTVQIEINDSVSNVDYLNASLGGGFGASASSPFDLSGVTSSDISVEDDSGSTISTSSANAVVGEDQVEVVFSSQQSFSDGDVIVVNIDGVTNPSEPGDYDLDVRLGETGGSTTSIDTTPHTIDPSLSINSGSFEIDRTNVFGTNEDVSFEVTNDGASSITADLFLNQTGRLTSTSLNNLDTDSSVSLDPGESTTLEATINSSADLNGVTASGAETVELNASVSTNPTYNQSVDVTVGSDSDGTATIDVIDDVALEGQEGIVVRLYNSSKFDTKDNPGAPILRNGTTNADGRVQFNDLAVGENETLSEDYTALAAPENNEFFSGTSQLELFETQQTEDAVTVTIERNATADRLTVVDDRSGIEDDIDNGNLPISSPDREASVTTEFDDTVPLDVFVETEDTAPVGQLRPFENEQVDYSITDTSDNTSPSDFDVTTTTNPTNADGFADFTVEVASGNVEDDFTSPLTVELTFEADSDSSSTDTVEVTFTPEIGDTGAISGSVDELTQDEQVGTQRESNIEPADDVPVHTVQKDRVFSNSTSDNSIAIEEDNSLATASSDAPTRLQPDADTASPGSVNVSQGQQFRVVTYQNGEEIVLDPRSDYLVTTTDDLEVIQNVTSTGFDVHENEGGTTIDIHFLEPGDYQVQQLVTWENSSRNEVVGQSWQNMSVETRSEDLGDPGSTSVSQTSTDDLYTVSTDLTFSATEDLYSADPTVQTDYTNSQGEFELYNLPTDSSAEGTDEYLVVAGAGDTEAADGTDEAVGFANFRGYGFVEVVPNADPNGPYDLELTVQDYEVDITYSYDLEVVVDDGGEYSDSTSIQTDTSTEVGVLVEATEIGGDSAVDADSDVVQGQEIDLTKLPDTTVGDLADTTVTVDDTVTIDGTTYAFASTTFTSDAISAGTTNISASTTNEENTLYETSSSGAGDNDVGDQAEIEVFKTIEVTGDVVNENDDNIKGARVLLFETGTVSDPSNLTEDDSEVIRSTNSGVEGSYVFTQVETGVNYTIKAIALDGNGNRVSNVRELNGGDPVNSALGGEDIVVIGASPQQALDDAFFDVSNLVPADGSVDQGNSLTVSADIDNSGAIQATKDVTLTITDDTGTEVFSTSKSVQLDTEDSTTVDFNIDSVDFDAGDYTHTISTEDDSEEGSLTVNETDTGKDLAFYQEYDGNSDEVNAGGFNQAIQDLVAGDIGGTLFNQVLQDFIN